MGLVLELINPVVLEQVDEFRDRFRSAKPFRHVVIDELLVPEHCRRLVEEFPGFNPQQARNEFGEVGRKAVHENLPRLGPAYRGFDRMLQEEKFLGLLGEITGIPRLLYDPHYVGGGTHENLHGQDLDPHVDFNFHPQTNLHRRLNLLLFLNAEWEPDWGGLLEIHRDPHLQPEEDSIKAIVPIENRCVLFETTEQSWHGFRRIQLPAAKRQLSRRSIAVYFYTRERPAEETAATHSTVYVQRPLPTYIQSGYTLSEQDLDRIRTLIDRRDKQIEYLYERECLFSSVIAGIERSPTFRFARLMSWPLRKIRDWVKTVRHPPKTNVP